MTPELAEQTFRRHIRRQPFRPFALELRDGRRIVVDQPGAAFGEDGAGFITEEDGLVDIQFSDLMQVIELVPEGRP